MNLRLMAVGIVGFTVLGSNNTVVATAATEESPPAWSKAHLLGPLSADETRRFARELAQFVFDNHLKKKADSPQRGMVYEYFDVRRKGQFDQFVQGEALDTMHDGAWLAAANVNAYRATGEGFYEEFLVRWQLPFYVKMLNHSDGLFTAKRNDAQPGHHIWGKQWLFQEGEKGFVPYFWDDGGSVSLERRGDKNPLGVYPCVDFLAGRPNPNYLLDGYSLGCSNHLAQDLGVMLQLAWLLLRESAEPAEKKLAEETAAAAKNLYQSRVRHHGPIPMCVAPVALAQADGKLKKSLPDPSDPRLWTPGNAYVRALAAFKPGERISLPGFADDQEYRYYHGIARAGGEMPQPLAFATVYDAFTVPLLYRYYNDDLPVPAGINCFDLHPYYCRDGKLEDYRSDRKGHYGRPKPAGSRMGPQNMVCCGWALQVLRAQPGIWEQRYRREFSQDLRVYVADLPPRAKRTAGPEPPAPPAKVEPGGVKLVLSTNREAFFLDGEFTQQEVVIKIFSQPDAQGSHAVIALKKGGQPIAVNDRGEKLLVDAKLDPSPQKIQFGLRIPYTVIKDQKPWLNGIEHGRYSIAVGQSRRNFYLASSEEAVKARLEHELGAGLRTWQAIFRELGYIPTALGAGPRWDHFSDSGGYAHLLSAAAQWLLYLDGKQDWEVHRLPKTGDAK